MAMRTHLEQMEKFNFEVSSETSLLSIAISLKRIADAMTSPNEFGEVGSEAIQGAIKRGMRGV